MARALFQGTPPLARGCGVDGHVKNKWAEVNPNRQNRQHSGIPVLKKRPRSCVRALLKSKLLPTSP